MEVIPLGVGGAFAKTLNNTNFLICPKEGEPFLLDCGFTASRALAAQGVALPDVSRILLSHLHADHIAGLEEFGFGGYFSWEEKAQLFVPQPLLELLWPRSLKGGMGQLLPGGDGTPFEAGLDTYFDVTSIGEGAALEFGSVEVTPFEVPHVPGRKSWGYVMADRASGGKAMFTCDTAFCRDNIIRHGRGSDVIFHDCQFISSDTIHASLGELLTLDDDWRGFEGRTGKMRLAQEGVALEV